MASENETIADIIAEKRRRADEIERDCAEKMKRGEMVSDRYARELVADIRKEADRLDAACKRELSDFNPKCDWSVQEALGFANTLANHGWTREANSDAASSCIYSLCRLLKERGDCAKLREALKKCLLYIACAEFVGIGTITLNDKVKLDPKKIIKSAKDALAAPARNCDLFNHAEPDENAKQALDAHGGLLICSLPNLTSREYAVFKECMAVIGWLFSPAKISEAAK